MVLQRIPFIKVNGIILSDSVTPRTTHSNIQKSKQQADPSEAVVHEFTYQIKSKSSRKSDTQSETKKAKYLIETAIYFLKRPEVQKTVSTSMLGAEKAFCEMVREIFKKIHDGYAKDMRQMDVLRQLYQAKHYQIC